MSLINIEGFEARSPRQGWSHSNFSTAGRFGGVCAHTGAVTYYPPSAIAELRMGFAMKMTGAMDGYLTFITPGSVTGGNGWELALYIRSDRTIGIHKYSTNSTTRSTPIALSSGPLADVGQWVYLEVGVKVASVGGYVEVRANGVPFLSYSGNTVYTGADPSQWGITAISWLNAGSNNFDDVYIADRLGTEYNDYIGEIQVEGLFPNGNGTFSQMTGSDGNKVDNYMLVDEAPAVETDLVQSDVVGERDTYQFSNLAVAAGQILAVQTSIAISKANAGPASARPVERLANGAERKGDPIQASNLMTYSGPVRTKDPEGAAWTVSSVNAAEFGVEVA